MHGVFLQQMNFPTNSEAWEVLSTARMQELEVQPQQRLIKGGLFALPSIGMSLPESRSRWMGWQV